LNRTATGSGGGTPGNAVNVSTAAANAAMDFNGSIMDADLTTFWAPTAGPAPWIYVDLGLVTSFDRIMLRWAELTGYSRLNTLSRRPERVVVEVRNDDAEDWVLIADFSNSIQVSSMTDILLKEQVSARYVRVSPTGFRQAAPAVGVIGTDYGARTYAQGVNAVAATTQFSLAAFEVYGFRNSIFVEGISGAGKVSVNGTEFTMANTANERTVMLSQDNKATLRFAPENPGVQARVLSNGVNITHLLNANNEIVLEDIDSDVCINVYYHESSIIIADKEALSPGDTVSLGGIVVGERNESAVLFAALYSADGRLERLESKSAGIHSGSAGIYIDFALPDDVAGKTLRAFLWDGSTYTPIVDSLVIN